MNPYLEGSSRENIIYKLVLSRIGYGSEMNHERALRAIALDARRQALAEASMAVTFIAKPVNAVLHARLQEGLRRIA